MPVHKKMKAGFKRAASAVKRRRRGEELSEELLKEKHRIHQEELDKVLKAKWRGDAKRVAERKAYGPLTPSRRKAVGGVIGSALGLAGLAPKRRKRTDKKHKKHRKYVIRGGRAYPVAGGKSKRKRKQKKRPQDEPAFMSWGRI